MSMLLLWGTCFENHWAASMVDQRQTCKCQQRSGRCINYKIVLTARPQKIWKTRDLGAEVSGERGQPPTIFCRLYVVVSLGDLISKDQLEIHIL